MGRPSRDIDKRLVYRLVFGVVGIAAALTAGQTLSMRGHLARTILVRSDVDGAEGWRKRCYFHFSPVEVNLSRRSTMADAQSDACPPTAPPAQAP